MTKQNQSREIKIFINLKNRKLCCFITEITKKPIISENHQ